MLVARRAVVVATGSSAFLPPISGLARVPAVDEHRGDDGDTRHRAASSILGGGVVGVELAQAWSALGSRVTLVHRGERLIEREEPFAGEQVAVGLRESGVDVRLGASATRVSRHGARRDRARRRLVARSRRGSGGVRPAARDRRDRPRDDGSRAGRPSPCRRRLCRVPGHDWLYAIGDVNGRALLTHMGKYQGRLARTRSSGARSALRSDGALSPRVIFTDPQVGAVGYTLAGALAAGLPARAVDVETSGNAGGSFVGRGAAGTARIVVDEEPRVIVGATITGSEVAGGPARGDDRRRRRGAARRSLARRAVVPDAQRALAAVCSRPTGSEIAVRARCLSRSVGRSCRCRLRNAHPTVQTRRGGFLEEWILSSSAIWKSAPRVERCALLRSSHSASRRCSAVSSGRSSSPTARRSCTRTSKGFYD